MVELVDTQDLKSCVRKDVWVQVPSGVLADYQRFSSLFKRAFFMPKNLGYNIGATNLGLRCTIKFHLGFKEQLLVFPLLIVFCNNLSLPKRLTQRYKIARFEQLLKTKKVQHFGFLKERIFYSRCFERKIWVQQNKKIL